MSADSSPMPLSDAQVERIAEKAAAKAIEKMTGHLYQEVGKTVVQRGLWVVGVVAVALFAFLAGRGVIKIP